MAVAEEGKHLLGRKVVSGNAQKRTSHANSRLFVKIFNACYKIFEGSIFGAKICSCLCPWTLPVPVEANSYPRASL